MNRILTPEDQTHSIPCQMTRHTDIDQRSTLDTFFNGRLIVNQSRDGYRFSIDAVLLAAAIHPDPFDTIVDLGTGCGIIPLILAFRFPDIRVCGVEIQTELADLARRNVRANGYEKQIEILNLDMKALILGMVPKGVNFVVSNPPYRKSHSGRINPNRQRALARHEISITLEELVHTANKILRKTGKFIMVYPAERMTDVFTLLRSCNLEPKHVRNIHTFRDTEAKLILIQSVKGGRPGLKVAPPLYIYEPDGGYTLEVQEMFRG